MDDLDTLLQDHGGLEGLARELGQFGADNEPQPGDGFDHRNRPVARRPRTRDLRGTRRMRESSHHSLQSGACPHGCGNCG